MLLPGYSSRLFDSSLHFTVRAESASSIHSMSLESSDVRSKESRDSSPGEDLRD